ncbi:MAG: biotin synthase BioB, partial [Planctomycetes bacterium]|nr:biotin synthase BioB [Planctomycetota bacterium]
MAVLPGQTPAPANRRAPEPPPGRRAPDAAALLRLVRPPRPLAETLRASGDLRARHAGKRVELCAIVNAKSGACPEDCRFCGQSSRSSAPAPVYPLLPAERLLDAARRAEDDGAMRFGVVASGNALRPKDFLAACRSLERLRAATRMALCASFGALTPRRARDLKAAG